MQWFVVVAAVIRGGLAGLTLLRNAAGLLSRFVSLRIDGPQEEGGWLARPWVGVCSACRLKVKSINHKFSSDLLNRMFTLSPNVP